MLCESGRAGKVRLDHLDEPRLGRGDAVPVEECFEVCEQEATFLGQLGDAGIEGGQAPAQLDRLELGEAELATQRVVAVAWVVNRVEDDPRVKRLDPRRDLLQIAQDRVRRLTDRAGRCRRQSA